MLGWGSEERGGGGEGGERGGERGGGGGADLKPGRYGGCGEGPEPLRAVRRRAASVHRRRFPAAGGENRRVGDVLNDTRLSRGPGLE